MGKRERFRWAWLRHWRGVVQVLVRLGICAGVFAVGVLLLQWIGPPAIAQPSGDDTADLQDARRVAFAELGRAVKAGSHHPRSGGSARVHRSLLQPSPHQLGEAGGQRRAGAREAVGRGEVRERTHSFSYHDRP